MIKGVLIIAGLVVSMNSIAQNTVDLYGDESPLSKQILKKYAKQVADEEVVFQAALRLPRPDNDPSFTPYFLKRMALAEKIKKEGDYLYVHFDTVYYPDIRTDYTTIEVVKKDQAQRMHYVEPIGPEIKYPVKDDLITQMSQFIKLESQLMLTNQLDLDPKHRLCPVYHCVTGFANPQLKPYLAIFNDGVVKQKKLILDTLNHDPNPVRRGAAAFLLGHLSNPHEIIERLLPLVNDSNEGVRNNVLRVIGATIQTAKITDMDAGPFLQLLNSPSETDRNKSLWVLLTLSQSNKAKPVIAQQGGEKLLELLRLIQPNNHDMAHIILKRVSGKEFGASDLRAWENWLASEQKKTA